FVPARLSTAQRTAVPKYSRDTTTTLLPEPLPPPSPTPLHRPHAAVVAPIPQQRRGPAFAHYWRRGTRAPRHSAPRCPPPTRPRTARAAHRRPGSSDRAHSPPTRPPPLPIGAAPAHLPAPHPATSAAAASSESAPRVPPPPSARASVGRGGT